MKNLEIKKIEAKSVEAVAVPALIGCQWYRVQSDSLRKLARISVSA